MLRTYLISVLCVAGLLGSLSFGDEPVAAAVAVANDGKILGLVVDEQGHKIAGASAILADATTGMTVDSTFSDSSGRFGFSDVAPGSYDILCVKLIGRIYAGRASVTVTGGRTTKVTVTLSPTYIFP